MIQAKFIEAEGMLDCIQSFCEASGQQMNRAKTKVCFSKNVNFSRALSLSRSIGVGLTGDLGKYLGIPLIHKRANYVTFLPILEKTRKKLSGWKRAYLNLAGRATLIKAVLNALPSYYMQTMLLPKTMLKELGKCSRSFLWGEEEERRKLHLISWDQITRDKKDGGLGIRDLGKQNKAFMMKLCWHLLNNKDALWVKVLRSKYKCGIGFMPKIQKKVNSSATWRGICAVWESFTKGVRINIGNGNLASFWHDNWSEVYRPLIELIPGYEAFVDRDATVSDYTNQSGQWDKEKLDQWFHPQVTDHIMCANPPRQERGEDKYFWKPSSDGCFSVKSAYYFLDAGTSFVGEPFWKTLWRCSIPEKMKSFLWLASHDRLHTAMLRAQKGLLDSAECPLGCDQEEDMMHLLRDCKNARERWIVLIHPTLWDKFTSLQGRDWINWNLKHGFGRDFIRKVQWASLFAYVCWDIWVTRYKKVFGEDIDTAPRDGQSSFFRASWDHDYLSQCQFYSQQKSEGQNSISTHREAGFVNLEVDGSALDSGQCSCGGVIRDAERTWIGGFTCKLLSVPPAITEIIAIIQGLQICWSSGYRNIFIRSDCIEAINLLTRGGELNHPFRDIIVEARLWLSRDWTVLLSYIPREYNREADHLARLGHTSAGVFVFFDQPPPSLVEAVVDDG